MGAHVIKVLVPALGLFAGQAVAEAASCTYPDEGNMPLRRAVSKVRNLPDIEAWASTVHKTGAIVQYALFLDRELKKNGRCYWTVEARAEGQVWRRFFVSPDGKTMLFEKPEK
jgi:hypothetical protein